MSAAVQVSVVMPVYNAAPFVRNAAEAALSQPEVAELILVEDCSPDDSLAVCRQLEKEDGRVRVLQHPDGGNHGAGATRNLGIENARCEYLTLADADNFFLTGRFTRDKELFLADPSIDGVYNAQGIHFFSEEGKRAFYEGQLGGMEFLTCSHSVPPEEFIYVMLGLHPTAKATLGIDAITLRRRAIEKAGMFNPALKLQQDVHWFIRLAATCRMAPGNLTEPVAMRGVHGQMRSTDPEAQREFRRRRWDDLAAWFKTADVDPSIKSAFRKALMRFRIASSPKWTARLLFLRFVAANPGLIMESMGFSDLTFLDLFGRNWLTLHLTSFKNRVLVGRVKRKRERWLDALGSDKNCQATGSIRKSSDPVYRNSEDGASAPYRRGH